MAEFLTLHNLCTKPFVYTENDDVFSTVTPVDVYATDIYMYIQIYR